MLNYKNIQEELNVYSLKSIKELEPYRKFSNTKTTFQIINTFSIYFIIWYLAYSCLNYSILITILLSIFNGGMIARIFAIQHDCGHGSLYQSKKLQNIIGCFCSLFTLVPYHYWRKVHAIHHADLGNLDKRSPGEFPLMTIKEYQQENQKKQKIYRIMRNPFVIFFIIPSLLFFVLYRRPRNSKEFTKKEKLTVYFTDIALISIVIMASMIVGFNNFLLIQLPSNIILSTFAVWMFYIQHQYENTYWNYQKDWNFFESAIKGSSIIIYPKFFQWLTGNSGFHYIHHLAPMIPNYSLEKCHKENPQFHKHLTFFKFIDSFKTLKLALWDEENSKLISFKEFEKKYQS